MNKKEIEVMLMDLKTVVEQHLRESGEIRTDLIWLKRAFWTLVAIAGTGLGLGLHR